MLTEDLLDQLDGSLLRWPIEAERRADSIGQQYVVEHIQIIEQLELLEDQPHGERPEVLTILEPITYILKPIPAATVM